MTYQKKPNTGTLFRNDSKQDKQPDLSGIININGVDYTLGAWERSSNSGTRFFRLTVKPKVGEQLTS